MTGCKRTRASLGGSSCSLIRKLSPPILPSLPTNPPQPTTNPPTHRKLTNPPQTHQPTTNPPTHHKSPQTHHQPTNHLMHCAIEEQLPVSPTTPRIYGPGLGPHGKRKAKTQAIFWKTARTCTELRSPVANATPPHQTPTRATDLEKLSVALIPSPKRVCEK